MQAVAILGAGALGAAIAHAVASRESAGEVRLVEETGTIAAGKALDIWQAGAVDGSRTRVCGSTSLADLARARVVVIADTAAGGEWAGDAGLALARRAAAASPHAIFVFPGADQERLIGLAHHELHVPRHRLVGTAPEALASAVRALAALLADASPADVAVPVLGAAGRWVFAWNESHAGGAPLSTVFSSPELMRLEARAHASWPPGPHTLGSAAAAAVHALLHGSSKRFAVTTVLDGEYGARNVVAAVPARLGPRGVHQVLTTDLSAREQVAFQSAVFAR